MYICLFASTILVNMTFFILKKTVFSTIAFLFVIASASAQLTTSTAMTPPMLVQNVLLGGGITATGISFVGDAQAIGSFNGSASNIGLASGVILSSGDIANCVGPNNTSGISSSNSLAGDPDLNMVMAPALSYEAAVLEFDFIPTSDTVKFRYVFGSDEYMEFVSPGGTINDGFGFFISGPGIAGPYSGGAINIALVPGTALPVTMQNINLSTNSSYYFDNGDGFGTGTAPDGLTVQYDGFTVPLTAIALVQCGQTYHIKIAIADGGDGIIDSGVFLEEGSFSSAGNVFMSSATSFGGSVTGDDTTIYEGCGFASVFFDRGTSNLAVADTFFYTLSGTATNGSDFTMIGDSVYFAPGQDSSYITINSLPDGLTEGTETVTLTVYANTPCGGADTATLTLYIIDSPPLTVNLNNDTLLYCPFVDLPLTASASGGVAIGSYAYSWTNVTSTTAAAIVNPAVTTTYYVTVTDSCGNTASDSIVVAISPYTPMQLLLSNDTIICGGNEVLLDANPSLGLPDYVYSWSPAISVIDSATVTPASSTTYTVVVTDACGLTVSDTVNITVYPIHADFAYSFTTNQNVQFLNQSTGAVSYLWNFGDGAFDSTSTESSPVHFYLADGIYVVTLIATNAEGCNDTSYQTVVVLPDFYFYFPNAFTPNANGNNDLFMGYGAGIKKFNMKIFDRWGEKLFETDNIYTGWDGTYMGNQCPSAVYVVVFDLEGYHYEIQRRIGGVTLVR
jgi:gliding motility-associated-like protein